MNDTLRGELLIRRRVEPIYEKDRIDPARQTRIGYQLKLDMPILKGKAVEALCARGARWLAGDALER